MMRERDFSADGHRPDRVGKGRVRLQTLVLIRWVAIAGQTAAILVAIFFNQV